MVHLRRSICEWVNIRSGTGQVSMSQEIAWSLDRRTLGTSHTGVRQKFTTCVEDSAARWGTNCALFKCTFERPRLECEHWLTQNIHFRWLRHVCCASQSSGSSVPNGTFLPWRNEFPSYRSEKLVQGEFLPLKRWLERMSFVSSPSAHFPPQCRTSVQPHPRPLRQPLYWRLYASRDPIWSPSLPNRLGVRLVVRGFYSNSDSVPSINCTSELECLMHSPINWWQGLFAYAELDWRR